MNEVERERAKSKGFGYKPILKKDFVGKEKTIPTTKEEIENTKVKKHLDKVDAVSYEKEHRKIAITIRLSNKLKYAEIERNKQKERNENKNRR